MATAAVLAAEADPRLDALDPVQLVDLDLYSGRQKIGHTTPLDPSRPSA